MNVLRIAVVLGLGLAALALGSSLGASSAPTVSTALKQKHKSKIWGTATLTQAGTGVRVVVRLRGRAKRVHPAHIHTGLCRNEPTFANPRIAIGLNNVVRRRSVTVARLTTVTELRSKPYSINVHDPNTLGVVACGDIPRS